MALPPEGQCRYGSGFLEAVANTIQRFDHIEVFVDDVELLAQPLDVAVDGAIVDVDLVRRRRQPSARHALLTTPGRVREGLQDQELGHSQHHGVALSQCAGVTLRIEAQLAALDHTCACVGRGAVRDAVLRAGSGCRTAFTRSTTQALREGLAQM